MADRIIAAPAPYEVRIPAARTTLRGATIDDLIATFERFRDAGAHGASDIGARWAVTRDGAAGGVLSYNGRFRPAGGAP